MPGASRVELRPEEGACGLTLVPAPPRWFRFRAASGGALLRRVDLDGAYASTLLSGLRLMVGSSQRFELLEPLQQCAFTHGEGEQRASDRSDPLCT
jgi:hypothetical protein